MNKSIQLFSVAVLALGISNAWAADTNATDKPSMGNMEQGGMQKGEMKGMDMDKEHMDKMHKHMDEMHKSNAIGDATKCDMKSDSKCDAKNMKSAGKPAADKAKAPVSADDHSAHHE